MDKAELIRHEIEKRRDHNLAIGNPLFAAMAEEDIELLLFIDSMQEEPVSEDLEKEIEQYEESFRHKSTQMGYKETARHFAQWQKEQMMSEAIDALVHTFDNGYVRVGTQLLDNNKYGLKVGEKFKVIIVKED